MAGRVKSAMVALGAAAILSSGCAKPIENIEEVRRLNSQTPIHELYSSATPIKDSNRVPSEKNLSGYINLKRTKISVSEFLDLLPSEDRTDIERFLLRKIGNENLAEKINWAQFEPKLRAYYKNVIMAASDQYYEPDPERRNKYLLYLLPVDALVKSDLLSKAELETLAKQFKSNVLPENVKSLEKNIVRTPFPRYRYPFDWKFKKPFQGLKPKARVTGLH